MLQIWPYLNIKHQFYVDVQWNAKASFFDVFIEASGNFTTLYNVCTVHWGVCSTTGDV